MIFRLKKYIDPTLGVFWSEQKKPDSKKNTMLMWLLERQIYKLDITLGMESPPWPTGSMRQWRAVEIFWSKFAR